MNLTTKNVSIFITSLMYVVSFITGTYAQGWSDETDKPVATSEVEAVEEAPIYYSAKAKRMTWRERKELGLTRGNVIRTAIRLHKDGKLNIVDEDMMANQIQAEIMADNPKAYANAGEFSDEKWDGIFAILMKLLPIILQIVAMFS